MATKPSKTDRALASVTRMAVLDALRRANEPMTVQQIAEELGLHPNTIRFHLGRLAQADLVREDQADPTGPGRPRMVYTAAPATKGAEQETAYRLLAEILASYLAETSPSPAAVATAAGQEWGRYLVERPAPFAKMTREEAIDRVLAMLAQLGFEPELDGGRLLLRACPFRAVADRRPDVTCSVHLGLMRGALAEMGAPVEIVNLQPFSAPHPCVANLSESDASHAEAGPART
ncbi:hypothetical protein TH66_05665 [Carbonactinospora thermoautotrophica]|uniref:HTH arsR-type domain-containing protein n=1 Tax=Carbonactinospora thermoautotrophica TaxID=1469144 RepID=A0A132N3W2_9ACTN|nr:helix-turn-helix domain-containing protein [Carbonactinospora thermoautotrophica]KWX04696.1 hypothetical protein TH66_05665 [Carbonactinospora thermoautotrophica]KWX08544.1 hypothetical protein TR74_14525 [Carbonactinospora thermoautotrophica]